jgi:hypothetical protein
MPEAAVGRTLRRLAVAGVAALALLPFANWIPGGHSVDWYDGARRAWLTGSLEVLGAAVVLAIVSTWSRWLWRERLLDPLITRWQAAPTLGPALLAAGSLAGYIWAALRVLGPRPLLIDEIIQTFQARTFAAGRLWLPQPTWPEFSSSMHLIDWGGKMYGQFPPGGAAIAALGTKVGMEWIVGPVAGALSVLWFAQLARRIAPTPGTGLGAALLFAFCPFVLFMSGSHMSHVTVLTCLTGAALALAIAMEGAEPKPVAAWLSGIGFGMAATIRPVDALAFALPAGAWYFARTVRAPGRWREMVAAGAGIAIPLAVMMWVNYRTTGGPLRFGYDVMWGDAKFFGFGTMPGGDSHTPIKGLELINIYLLRLETYLFETPVPSLVLALGALFLVDRMTAFERYFTGSAALFLLLYSAYWHDGFFLGPRLVYPLVPVAALWTARAFTVVRERWGARLGWRAMVWGGAVSAGMAVAVAIPSRARQYRGGLLTMRWDPDSAAARARVRGALVLVRESWGAQLLVRLWAQGISRSNAEAIYSALDQCELETDLTWAEQHRASMVEFVDRIRPALADQGKLVRAPDSPDPTARYLPGRPYTPLCQQRQREEQEGFTLFPPLLLARGDNIYLRDLHARDSLLLRALPDRPVYLLKPPGSAEGAPPQFYPVRRDSLYAAWADEARHSSSGSARQ